MQIIRYKPNGREQLKPLRKQFYPDDPVWVGEWGWTAVMEGRPLGYVCLEPVEGLPHIAELTGGVIPQWRRRGIGRALLAEAIWAAQQTGQPFTMLSTAVHDPKDDAAKFLQAQGFKREHDEVLLRLDAVDQLPQPRWPFGTEIVRRPAAANALFCQLYDQAFSPHPWYQPYDPAFLDEEMPFALFIKQNGQFAAFADTHLNKQKIGQIEPLGVIPAFQGQGLARPLFLAACRALLGRGATALRVGAWLDNQKALNVYQSAGFQPERYTYYYSLGL